MIARNAKTFFGGRVTEIHTSAFRCVVSTEREGVFGRLATVIIDSELPVGDMERLVCSRISHQPDLGKAEIQDLHATIVATINEGGRRGIPLGVAMRDAIDYLAQKGLALEPINTRRRDPKERGVVRRLARLVEDRIAPDYLSPFALHPYVLDASDPALSPCF